MAAGVVFVPAKLTSAQFFHRGSVETLPKPKPRIFEGIFFDCRDGQKFFLGGELVEFERHAKDGLQRNLRLMQAYVSLRGTV